MRFSVVQCDLTKGSSPTARSVGSSWFEQMAAAAPCGAKAVKAARATRLARIGRSMATDGTTPACQDDGCWMYPTCRKKVRSRRKKGEGKGREPGAYFVGGPSQSWTQSYGGQTRSLTCGTHSL